MIPDGRLRYRASEMDEGIRDLLVSPCCRSRLTDLSCLSCGRTFREIQGQPVLIVFESSVIDEEALDASNAAAPISRAPRGRFHALHRRVEGENDVAKEHIAALLDLLPTWSRVLVVGGATIGKGTEALYAAGSLSVTSFDIYATPYTHLIADAHHIPFANASFDAVIIQAVLEHVLDPAQVVAEIHRVLKPDGIVYAETPFLQHVHEGPYDFHRFTDSGHRWLFRRFELIDSGVVAGAGYQALWSLDHLVRNLFESARAGLAMRRMIAFPLRLIESRRRGSRYAIDAASCVYFFGRRSETEIGPREIIDYYQGAQTLPRQAGDQNGTPKLKALRSKRLA